jgi:hypothetical protein
MVACRASMEEALATWPRPADGGFRGQIGSNNLVLGGGRERIDLYTEFDGMGLYSQITSISIDPTLPLSINLQLAQCPLGYMFNMTPTFNSQSKRQFLISFEVVVIFGGGDEATHNGNKGTNPTMVLLATSKINLILEET